MSEIQPPPRLTIFVHLTALPAWLALGRPECRQIIAEHVEPPLERHSAVQVRWFDAEAWAAAPSDVLMATTDDPTAWSDLFEGLRDSPLWSVPYFRVDMVLPAVEDGFADYERRTGQRG
ncbi:darcynin family protein [Streptomyces sparsogenes]|uniref:darcynin family protein n=1 Tax=Streptomyces sparsogenes TaxID=67365 RepID=UPI003407DC63